MTYRLLEQGDFQKGFLELLTQLTTVGSISVSEYATKFAEIISNPNHKIYVLEQGKKIVSCATLFVEPKFIHECGFVGHIEDVVVDKACRGQRLGKKIIDFLTNEAERLGCYKILLDCSDKNVGFYEKCDYLRKGACMAKYLNPIKVIDNSSTFTKALKNVDLFCKNHYKGIILVNVALFASYYVYKNYWDVESDSDEE